MLKNHFHPVNSKDNAEPSALLCVLLDKSSHAKHGCVRAHLSLYYFFQCSLFLTILPIPDGTYPWFSICLLLFISNNLADSAYFFPNFLLLSITVTVSPGEHFSCSVCIQLASYHCWVVSQILSTRSARLNSWPHNSVAFFLFCFQTVPLIFSWHWSAQCWPIFPQTKLWPRIQAQPTLLTFCISHMPVGPSCMFAWLSTNY
jgi:hypothetical protein